MTGFGKILGPKPCFLIFFGGSLEGSWGFLGHPGAKITSKTFPRAPKRALGTDLGRFLNKFWSIFGSTSFDVGINFINDFVFRHRALVARVRSCSQVGTKIEKIRVPRRSQKIIEKPVSRVDATRREWRICWPLIIL